MKGVVEGIFVTSEGSAAMERVEEVQTIEGCGIEGDRYCEGTGFWTRYGDVCQVTLIEGEDLDYIEDSEAETDMNIVMNDAGHFIEIQGTAEGHAFRLEELHAMLDLAKQGIGRILENQRGVLGI